MSNEPTLKEMVKQTDRLEVSDRLYKKYGRALTLGEGIAIQSFALANGKRWKSKLRDFWMTGKDESDPYLRSLRNNIGPSGLDMIKVRL